MVLADKYINPLTDFGFKKLFGEEVNKDLLIDFAAAEIAKYSKEERAIYEESLKYYRNLKNVVDTAYDDGKSDGKIEGEIEEKNKIAKKLKLMGLSIKQIQEASGLSKEEIEKL